MKKKLSGKKTAPAPPKNWNRVRRIALTLPGVEEGTSYGTPAFRVAGKLFTRLHDNLDSLVIRIDEADRRMRMEADPKAFYITDHYAPYPWMLVRLAHVEDSDLAELLEEAWQLVAPVRLILDLDRTKSPQRIRKK
jgi:hypothetical protein